MEFYLIMDQTVEFLTGMSVYGSIGSTGMTWMKLKSEPMQVKLASVVENSNDAKDYCRALMNSLMQRSGDGSRKQEDLENPSWNITPTIRAFFSICGEDSKEDYDYIQLSNGREDNGESILQRLLEVFGKDCLKIKLTVNDFVVYGSRQFDLEMKGSLQLLNETYETGLYGCQFNKPAFPQSYRTMALLGAAGAKGHTAVTLIVNDQVVNKLYLEEFQKLDLKSNYKNVLKKALFSDFVIVGSNGVEVKCHKVFLASISDVFKTMFEAEMNEVKDNRLERVDMSEAVIRALLAFIYHRDLEHASGSCDIALQLLQAGHQYRIPSLEEAMSGLICAKLSDWFSVDMTVRLLLFGRILDNEDYKDKLVEKALCVLKRYSITSPNLLMDSEEYNELFQKHQEIAKQLSALFLKI